MLPRNGRAWTAVALASLLTSSLSACAKAPPVVSADTSCISFRRIDTTPDQDLAAKANPNVWWPLYVQIAEHDTVLQKRCSPK